MTARPAPAPTARTATADRCAAVLVIAVDAPLGRAAVDPVLPRITAALAAGDPPARAVRFGPAAVVAVLLVTGADEAERVAEAVRGSVAGLTAHGTGEAVTVGVAVDRGSAAAALWAADHALWAATRAGTRPVSPPPASPTPDGSGGTVAGRPPSRHLLA